MFILKLLFLLIYLPFEIIFGILKFVGQILFIGYVANSPYTVLGESVSAGRLYDRIDDVAYGVVKFVLPQGVVCEIMEKEIL